MHETHPGDAPPATRPRPGRTPRHHGRTLPWTAWSVQQQGVMSGWSCLPSAPCVEACSAGHAWTVVRLVSSCAASMRTDRTWSTGTGSALPAWSGRYQDGRTTRTARATRHQASTWHSTHAHGIGSTDARYYSPLHSLIHKRQFTNSLIHCCTHVSSPFSSPYECLLIYPSSTPAIRPTGDPL